MVLAEKKLILPIYFQQEIYLSCRKENNDCSSSQRLEKSYHQSYRKKTIVKIHQDLKISAIFGCVSYYQQNRKRPLNANCVCARGVCKMCVQADVTSKYRHKLQFFHLWKSIKVNATVVLAMCALTCAPYMCCLSAIVLPAVFFFVANEQPK